jgi:AraC-like DNA-binding protein
MKPLRKQFHTEAPFPLEYAYRNLKNQQNELPDHLHDWYEIVYIHAGKGIFFIDQTFYEMNPGDVFVLPGSTVHRSFPDNDNPITATAVFFHPVLLQQVSLGDSFSYFLCFEHAKKHKNHKLDMTPDDQSVLDSLLQTIHQELKGKAAGYRHAAVLGLKSILLLLARKITLVMPERAAGPAFAPQWMHEILHLIDGHSEEDVSLSALSAKAAVNPSHFSRVFKRLTGMTLTEYVTIKRIIRAKDLLLGTDSPVRDIAADCGFESLPHFHRMFKKLTGTTPAAYKRSSGP